MRALPGTPVGGLFPPRLPPAIGEGQPHMAEQNYASEEEKNLEKCGTLCVRRGQCNPREILHQKRKPFFCIRICWCNGAKTWQNVGNFASTQDLFVREGQKCGKTWAFCVRREQILRKTRIFPQKNPRFLVQWSETCGKCGKFASEVGPRMWKCARDACWEKRLRKHTAFGPP